MVTGHAWRLRDAGSDVSWRRHRGLDTCHGSEEIDQWYLLFQQVGRLERIARKALNAGQFQRQLAPLHH